MAVPRTWLNSNWTTQICGMQHGLPGHRLQRAQFPPVCELFVTPMSSESEVSLISNDPVVRKTLESLILVLEVSVYMIAIPTQYVNVDGLTELHLKLQIRNTPFGLWLHWLQKSEIKKVAIESGYRCTAIAKQYHEGTCSKNEFIGKNSDSDPYLSRNRSSTSAFFAFSAASFSSFVASYVTDVWLKLKKIKASQLFGEAPDKGRSGIRVLRWLLELLVK